MEKSELIGELYALRAGLSALSLQYDEVRGLEASKMDRANEFFKKILGETYINDEEFPDARPFYMMCTFFPGDDYATVDSILASANSEKDYKWMYKKVLDCGCFKLLKGVSYSLLAKMSAPIVEGIKSYNAKVEKYSIDGFDYEKEESELHINSKKVYSQWLGTAESRNHFEAMTSAFGEAIKKQSAVVNKMGKTMFLAFKKDVKHKLAEEKQRLNALESAYGKLQDALSLVKNWQTENGTVETCVTQIKNRATVFFKALCEEFTPIIDVRDWKYLDFVLFYLETRRADTLKEALQQVDTEVRARRLENTFKEAMEQIRETLSYGLSSIRNSVETCFSKLSTRLSKQHSETSAQLDRLTDTVAIGNALQAKANVTSEKLMQDVNYIRNIAFS